jgi:hypothetical protein
MAGINQQVRAVAEILTRLSFINQTTICHIKQIMFDIHGHLLDGNVMKKQILSSLVTTRHIKLLRM